jgi:hypothetical protein
MMLKLILIGLLECLLLVSNSESLAIMLNNSAQYLPAVSSKSTPTIVLFGRNSCPLSMMVKV